MDLKRGLQKASIFRCLGSELPNTMGFYTTKPHCDACFNKIGHQGPGVVLAVSVLMLGLFCVGAKWYLRFWDVFFFYGFEVILFCGENEWRICCALFSFFLLHNGWSWNDEQKNLEWHDCSANVVWKKSYCLLMNECTDKWMNKRINIYCYSLLSKGFLGYVLVASRWVNDVPSRLNVSKYMYIYKLQWHYFAKLPPTVVKKSGWNTWTTPNFSHNFVISNSQAENLGDFYRGVGLNRNSFATEPGFCGSIL